MVRRVICVCAGECSVDISVSSDPSAARRSRDAPSLVSIVLQVFLETRTSTGAGAVAFNIAE